MKGAAKGGYAEVSPDGEVTDAHGLGGVVADPLDGPADAGKFAAGEAELADGFASRAVEQQPEDLPAAPSAQDRQIAWPAEEARQARDGGE